MKKIGLTGGIGAGKSIVAQILTTMGFPVFYSDQVGKELMVSDQGVITKVKVLFGEEAYQNNQLNRAYIAQRVFNDETLKTELNAIVHPAVRNTFSEWQSKLKCDLCFNEAAILFETGAYKLYDKNILVTAPEEIRIKRVMSRDQTSRKQIADRIKNQWSDSEKTKFSDFLIVNDNLTLLVPQVEMILSELYEKD